MATSPNREDPDTKQRSCALSPALHYDVASTSHGVRNADYPIAKKSRLHGATYNDVATEESTLTNERNAISVLFGLARKRDNKDTVRLFPEICILAFLQSLSDLPSLIPEQQQRSATSLNLVPATLQITLHQGASTSGQVFPPSVPHPGAAAEITGALQQSSALWQTQTSPPTMDTASLQQLLTLSSLLQQLRGQAVRDIQTVQEPSGSNQPTTAAQNLAFESKPFVTKVLGAVNATAKDGPDRLTYVGSIAS